VIDVAISHLLSMAWVAELADAPDLKPSCENATYSKQIRYTSGKTYTTLTHSCTVLSVHLISLD
jgi:hypothetical protein